MRNKDILSRGAGEEKSFHSIYACRIQKIIFLGGDQKTSQ